MTLSDRLAVCSWWLQPASPQALADSLRAIGIMRTQLALDPVRAGGAWADGVAALAALGVSIASGMFAAVGEDYSTLDSIRRTGGVVPDATWPQTFANFRQMAPIAERAGIDQITCRAGFLRTIGTTPITPSSRRVSATSRRCSRTTGSRAVSRPARKKRPRCVNFSNSSTGRTCASTSIPPT